MQGLITLRLLNAKTLEVEQELHSTNIIKASYFRQIFENGVFYKDFAICVTNAAFKESYIYSCFPIGDSDIYKGTNAVISSTFYVKRADSAPGGQNYMTFLPGTETVSPIIQYASRFNSPTSGTTRTIKTVVLTRGSFTDAMAYSELQVPCVQTDSQILDIQYRVVFNYETPLVLDNNVLTLSKKDYNSLLYNLGVSATTSYAENVAILSPFPIIKRKLADLELVTPSYFTMHDSASTRILGLITPDSGGLSVVNSNPEYIKKYLPENASALSRYVGVIHGSAYMAPSNYPNYGVDSLSPLSASNLFTNRSKIQNIFGYSTDSNLEWHEPFLEVNNLASGTGSVIVEGNWEDAPLENNATTIANGTYYKTLFPRRDIITITQGGDNGVAEYKYSKESYLRTTSSTYFGAAKNIKCIVDIPSLASSTLSTDRHALHNRGLLGNVSPNSFDIEQLSASIPYDGTNVLIPTKTYVLLYSVPSSNYWFIRGGFTKAHQLETVGDWIFIACYETGLWMCNPKISLTATKVTMGEEMGADWSTCNGVGYDGVQLFALATNALVNLDVQPNGTLSTNDYIDESYDFLDAAAGDTTSAPLIARIGYFKVDGYDGWPRFFFVYNPRLAVGKFGFWYDYSTFTNVTKSIGSTYTMPDFMRNQIKPVAGEWYFGFDSLIKYANFGSTTFTSTTFVQDGLFSSILSVKNKATNKEYIVNFYDTVPYAYSVIGVKLFDTDTKTIVLNTPTGLKSGIALKADSTHSFFSNYPTLGDPLSRSGNSIRQISMMLEGGIVFNLRHFKTGTDNFHIGAFAFVLGTEGTPHGGAYRWIYRTDYGWSTTAWVENHPGSRITSASPQSLGEGLTVRFENGAAGTSFQTGNLYKFGLCRGLMKDNATKYKMQFIQSFRRKETKRFALGTLGAATSGVTGLSGLNPYLKSKDAYIKDGDKVAFPGNNSGQYALSNIRLIGDFKITVSASHRNNTNITTPGRVMFGVGFGKIAVDSLAFTFYNSSELQVKKNTSRDPETSNRATPNYQALSNNTDTFSLVRVNNAFTVQKNGTTVYTITNDAVKEAEQVLDIVYTLNRDIATEFFVNMEAPLFNIETNGSAYFVDFPSEYVNDPKVFNISANAPIQAYLNGNPALTKIDGTLPGPGEVSVIRNGLYAIYNAADVGATLEVECTLDYNI